jgi:hypothetical protein
MEYKYSMLSPMLADLELNDTICIPRPHNSSQFRKYLWIYSKSKNKRYITRVKGDSILIRLVENYFYSK